MYHFDVYVPLFVGRRTQWTNKHLGFEGQEDEEDLQGFTFKIDFLYLVMEINTLLSQHCDKILFIFCEVIICEVKGKV